MSGGVKGCIDGSEQSTAGWHSDAGMPEFALELLEILSGDFLLMADSMQFFLDTLLFVGWQFNALFNAVEHPT